MKKHNIVGIVFLVIGVGLFGYYATQPNFVDAQGILHEPFYLIGLGYMSIFSGIIILGVGNLISWVRNRNRNVTA